MNRRKLGILLTVCGIGSALVINLLDFIRGREFSFGPVQAVVTLLSALLILAGLLAIFTRIPMPSRAAWQKAISSIENFLGGLESWFRKSFKATSVDWLVIAGFVLFALIYTLGRWNGITPFIYLGSDSSYYSSYAASLDHPELFANDFYLSNQSLSSYISLHIPLIRILNTLVGSYGNAYLVLLPITLFLKLFGFYFLGKRLFKNRALALLLTVVTFPIIYTGAWDYWGLLGDVLARNLFEIALPWLILWTYEWIDKPKHWLLLSFLLGALAYVHLISTGIIFFTVLFVYLILSPAPFVKRIGQLLASASVFAVTVIPLILLYRANSTATISSQLTYKETLELLYSTYGQNHFAALSIFVNTLQTLTKSGILPLTLLALLFLIFTKKVGRRGAWLTVAVWILGILIVSVAAPYLERLVDPWLQMITVQMMLVRGLRYLPPLLFLFIFLAFFDQNEGIKLKYPCLVNASAVILLVISLALVVANNQQDGYFSREVKCLASGRLVCPTPEEKDAVDIIRALDNYTTPGDRVLAIPPLSVSFSTAIRYQALRPMGYSKADVTRMSEDPVLQQQINAAMKPWNALEHADEDTRLTSYLSLAADMQADYLIVQLDDFTPASVAQLDPVYANDHYALVAVSE